MSLGSGNFAGNNNQRQESSYYSRLRFVDNESGKSVRIKYWKGLMSISIAKSVEVENAYKIDDIASIYLSPLKARVLANALEEFVTDKKHPAVGVNVGITETQTCITFWYNDDGSISMAIAKIDGSGNKESEEIFKFAIDYDFYLEYKDYSKMKFEKKFAENSQVNSIIIALREYFNGICGGVAYSVMDFGKFELSRTTTKLNAIMDKLGIQRQSSSYSASGGENSYFNKQGAAPAGSTYSDHHSADDLDDLIS